ncbi:hypothetical protein D9756_006919 [Leucocoprinus leucothites]|uniref:Uncharacterized protein n=1 Tax=Leucocoprinus leucothites TaxID=201217 RepID=A0A8H5D5W2_9AGAR|nr:hypothetical protein D9756_006919 [Leucoagaricus leucothites]
MKRTKSTLSHLLAHRSPSTMALLNISTKPQIAHMHTDVFKTGAIITAVCIVIFVLTSVYLAILLIRPTSFTRPRIIAIQGGILAFFAAWLFAALVPYTHFFRTRSAGISASLGGRPIPQSILQPLINSIERQTGITPRYRDHGYLRLVAILPWITLLFTIIASVTLYVAASRSKTLHHTRPAAESAGGKDAAETSDKADSPVTEKVESPTV